MQAVARAVLSIAIGAISAPYLIWTWAQVSARGLILEPLVAAGLTDSLLRAAVSGLDLLTSLLILLPVALVLRSLGLPRLPLHTGLAALALFAVSCALVGWPIWPTSWQSFMGNVSPYIALCLGVWLCASIWRAPNNSFKPKPLRGSA